MRVIEAGDVKRSIVSVVSYLSYSMRNFATTVERIVDKDGVDLYVFNVSIVLNSDSRVPCMRVLMAAATFAESKSNVSESP